MSKNKFEVTKPVKLVTEALNKKGALKGKSKKETKVLKALCPHHKYSKKGKLKPTIFNNGDGTCVCTMCGKKFPASLYNNENLGQIVGDMKTLNEQSKYMAVATGAGPATIDYYSQFGVMIGNYKKSYKKLRNVIAKQDSIKQKKKKRAGTTSAQYGSWGRR